MSVANPVIDHLDPATKSIYLAAGVAQYHPVTDIYAEVRTLRRLNDALRWFDVPVTAEGNIPKGGGKYTSRYAVFNNGWRVVPTTGLPVLYISGEQITDDGQSGPDCIDLTLLPPGTGITIMYEPPASELVRADAELEAVKQMEYNNRVAIDPTSPFSGTLWPMGTRRQPINNLVDALLIMDERGFATLDVLGNLTLQAGDDVGGLSIIGQDRDTNTLTLEDGCLTWGANISNLTLTGVCGGRMNLHDCHMKDIVGLCATDGNANISNCYLMGSIQLRSLAARQFIFTNCVGAEKELKPTLDINGSPATVHFNDFAGELYVGGATNPEQHMAFDIDSGTIKFLSTVTQGQHELRGIAKFVDETTPQDGLFVDTSGLLRPVDSQYGGRVYIDATGAAGTLYPLGLFGTPVNSIANAALIAPKYNCNDLHVHSDTQAVGQYLRHYIVSGHAGETISFDAACDLDGLIFKGLGITGTLSGSNEFEQAILKDVDGVSGQIKDCMAQGDIGFTGQVYIRGLRSHSQNPINLNVGTAMLNATDIFGMFTVTGKSGTEEINLHCGYGAITIDETCTGPGQIYLVGNGVLIAHNGSCPVVNLLESDASGAEAVMRYTR
jgi:hypothetical protein